MGSRLGPPLLSGILLAAATPPSPSPVLPFVALVPLVLHVASLTSTERAGARAFAAGALVASIQHAWGLRWLLGTLTAVAGPLVGMTATLAVIATLAAFGGAAAWCLLRFRLGHRPLPLAAALAIVWTALEWTLAHLPLGLAFPWAPLGLGLARWPASVGIAELVGVTGVTAWLALVNGAVASGLLAWIGGTWAGRARATGRALAFALVLALAPLGWGAWRARGTERDPVGAVVALALDVPTDGDPQAGAEAAVAAAERAIAALPASTGRGPDLIVLPEMALPMDVDAPVAAALLARLRQAGARAGAPVLTGARTTEDGREFNAAVLLADPIFRPAKRRLVPGAERGSALAPAWLASTSGGYQPGRDWPVLDVGPLHIGVLICYEVAFASDARRLVRSGARTLVVISNDAWFGGGSGGRPRDAGIAQQLAHLTLRGIETRVGVVRSANGGPAAVVDAAGRMRLAATPGALYATVPGAAPPTLYALTGDWIGPLAAAALLLLLVLGSKARSAGTQLAHP